MVELSKADNLHNAFFTLDGISLCLSEYQYNSSTNNYKFIFTCEDEVHSYIVDPSFDFTKLKD